MKNFSARLAVVALALTGFAASTVISKAAPIKTVTPKVLAMGTTPAMLCSPRHPEPCGLD